jgi:hypothetical protein
MSILKFLFIGWSILFGIMSIGNFYFPKDICISKEITTQYTCPSLSTLNISLLYRNENNKCCNTCLQVDPMSNSLTEIIDDGNRICLPPIIIKEETFTGDIFIKFLVGVTVLLSYAYIGDLYETYYLKRRVTELEARQLAFFMFGPIGILGIGIYNLVVTIMVTYYSC